MATYTEIQRQTAARLGLSPSTILTGWIAAAKRALGLPVRRAHNWGVGKGTSQCPPEIWAAIIQELSGAKAPTTFPFILGSSCATSKDED